jgi:hypothetical protein
MATAKLVVASLCLFILLKHYGAAAAAVSASRSCHGGRAATAVEAMFVFGSSLVDNGNNNFLNGSGAVRADYPPYGVDFPPGPTGRFSNGRNTIDALGELLRLPAIPPFAGPAARGRAALRGVNFASGGSGILDTTGKDPVSSRFDTLLFSSSLLHCGILHTIPVFVMWVFQLRLIPKCQAHHGIATMVLIIANSIFFA